jgi:uncharacterized protein YbbC (DUF1343 family)
MATYHRPQSRSAAHAGLTLWVLFSACAPPAGSAAEGTDDGSADDGSADVLQPVSGPVLPGIDVLFRDSLHLVRGRRVGLITNPTGMDATGRSTIDRLFEHPDVDLVTLFAPEHGLRAAVGEGRLIEDSRDPTTGLPVVSLYAGSKRAPSADDLSAVDVVVFDMQDIGARYYTYVSTMSLAMEAAGAAGVPFVVLDRPNPLGAPVQGNVLDPAYATFVGLHPVPMRHGMTAGELARLYRGRFGVEGDLTVVPVDGWDPAARFDATRLPWVAPSPNIPDLTSALHYPGTCLFEGTDLSVGRGTDRPFQQIGAPWLDGTALAARLEGLGLPGVRFQAVTFTPVEPSDGKWAGETVSGVRFVATDLDVYDPTVAAVAALAEARRMAGDRWTWNVAHFDRLAGTDALRLGLDAGTDPAVLTATWADQRASFEVLAAPYRLYAR